MNLVTGEEFEKEILSVIVGLDESVLFDNDGCIVGYMESSQVSNHKELLDKKNQMIKEGWMTQVGFEALLFNYGENGIMNLSCLSYEIPENGIDCNYYDQ